MKVLLIGSGGREHALAWKIRQSPSVTEIFCTPGNAGIQSMAKCVDIPVTDIEGLARFASEQSIDLTVVGPEAPLTLGIVDLFTQKGLRIFGPTRSAASLEGSKVFTKDLMHRYGIPTGAYAVFRDQAEALAHVEKMAPPMVVKADGLAAGKGVVVCQTKKEARAAIELIMQNKAFGKAGDQVVIEEFLTGEEASFLAFTDGKTVLPLPTSQDHKAIYDGDQGPNTGGMGAYSPAPVVTEALHRAAMEQVMLPTVRAMAAEGHPYQGILYAGLMIDQGKIKVLEFNCRFGDPECQPLLMRLKSDIVPVMLACIEGKLDTIHLDIDPRPTVCVVMAAGGYPGAYEKGKEIRGLAEAAAVRDVAVFHAGTAMQGESVVTAGGRVLGVTAIGDTLRAAVAKAYEAANLITWDGCFFRRDIAHKALRRETGAQVGIIMGSDSDLPIMRGALDFLREIGISVEVTVASAHRTPARAMAFAETARARGLKVIIAGAGMAAHLAGVLAAHTTLPVIGVPIDSSALNGLDALLSTVQMPPGVPVATMGIGKSGARNAGILAAQILATADPVLASKLEEFKRKMAAQVEEKARALVI